MAFISNIFHYNNISLLKGTFVDKQQQRKKENCFIRFCLALQSSIELVHSISAYAMRFYHNSEITPKNFHLFIFRK